MGDYRDALQAEIQQNLNKIEQIIVQQIKIQHIV